MKKTILVIGFIMYLVNGFSQNVSVNSNGTPPDPSAQLDVSATDKGMLIPRMNATNRTAIVSPAEGLMVYQKDAPSGFYYFNGLSWNALSSLIPGSSNFSFKGSDAQGFFSGSATKVIFSIQNYLNNATFTNSIFTAPAAGLYSFTVNLNIYGNSATSSNMGFYVNNISRSTSTFNIIGAVFQNVSYTDNLLLASGDQVTVQVQPSVYISGFALNFTGYKVN